MGIVSRIVGIFQPPVAVRNDCVYFQIERNLKTGKSLMSISVTAPTEHVEKLEALLKSHCYTLLADYAASRVDEQPSGVVVNLPARHS
jgi:hypothetical protein